MIYVNTYNVDVGQTLNEVLVLLMELVVPIWREVVSIYNVVVYLIVGF